MLCRCVLYMSEAKKEIDLRCHHQTTHKTGVCDHCRKHRAEDRKSGAYKGRWGLAPKARR